MCVSQIPLHSENDFILEYALLKVIPIPIPKVLDLKKSAAFNQLAKYIESSMDDQGEY